MSTSRQRLRSPAPGRVANYSLSLLRTPGRRPFPSGDQAEGIGPSPIELSSCDNPRIHECSCVFTVILPFCYILSMTRLLLLPLAGCLMALLLGCAAEGSGLNEPLTPEAPSAEAPEVPANLCRTEDDCAPSEQCVVGAGRYLVCAKVDGSSAAPKRGPQGQPPPPAGLLEGAARFAAQPERARR